MDTNFLSYSGMEMNPVHVMIAGVVAWRTAKVNREAAEKADRLIAALHEFGARTPSREQVVRVLGTDGGAVCADPAEALTRAARLAGLTNGAGGPGQRPEFQRFVDGLRTAGVDGE